LTLVWKIPDSVAREDGTEKQLRVSDEPAWENRERKITSEAVYPIRREAATSE